MNTQPVFEQIESGHEFTGRKKIVLACKEVTRDNLINVLTEALVVHWFNASQIDYLYRYYKGHQPILLREKKVRPEICNRIVENRANEIVSFKTGYLMGEPVQYVARTDEQSVCDDIGRLNEVVFAEDKAAKDKELADWMHICGTAYRIILPEADHVAPFRVYTADPRYTFVVYSNGLGQPPIMGVSGLFREDGKWQFNVYTKDRYFEVCGNEILKEEPHIMGAIPIIEYPAGPARLGSFEIVLPLLDAINNVDSNRMDDIEQIVQSLLLFHNVNIDKETFKALREEGAIKFNDVDPNQKGDIKYISAMMSQEGSSNFSNHLYDTVLTICGMPNRNGGSSTSDTGAAVIMRDGWSAAEARAKDTELMFKRAEKDFLKVLLAVCDADEGTVIDLKLSDIEIRFTRRNYEAIQEKSQVLTTMLNNDKIHPLLAFTHSGMFSDPQVAYQMSMEYMEEANETANATERSGSEPDGDGASDGENPNEG